MNLKSRFNPVFFKTRLAFFLSGILNEPLFGLITILPFILRKDLHVSSLHIACFNTIKPSLSLLAFYWGAYIWRNKHYLKLNWIGSWFLARVPFLLFPFIKSPFFYMFSVAIFHFFHKGAVPAQMEILKQNVPLGIRETLFSWSSVLNFMTGIIIGLLLSQSIEEGPYNWKILFFFSALIGICSIFFQNKVPIQSSQHKINSIKTHWLLDPWINSWDLLKQRHDFARFQIGFMLGGIGLMLIMPALVLYSVDELALGHDWMVFSRLICLGVGFVLATPFWKKSLSYQRLYVLTAIACGFFALSSICWMLASFSIEWFFIAFFLYGVAQAGSHLIWHLSGPLFAGTQDSSLFSTVNILTVGIRGIIVPFISGLLCDSLGSMVVLGLGTLFCFLGALYCFRLKSLGKLQQEHQQLINS